MDEHARYNAACKKCLKAVMTTGLEFKMASLKKTGT
jgi:hypothetical protein